MFRRRPRVKRPWLWVPVFLATLSLVLVASLWIAQPGDELLRHDYFHASVVEHRRK
jgi:hypothetical protein